MYLYKCIYINVFYIKIDSYFRQNIKKLHI